ncbi:MAG: hypothetical protein Q8M08_04050 [Bacteroidales bacterium]|nr:hypothetical protein [Bacteroidales bacterium]
MNTGRIEAILKRYYEGNTSLQEEKILRDFFQGQDVPAHLRSHQSMFAYYVEEQRQEINDPEFNNKVMERIAEEQPEQLMIRIHPNRNRMMFIISVAASVLLLAGLFFVFQNDLFNTSLTKNGPNPEIAYADVSETLMVVSGNLNYGLKHVNRLQMVDKAMKNMQLFGKFYQYQTIIINPDEIVNQSINSK